MRTYRPVFRVDYRKMDDNDNSKPFAQNLATRRTYVYSYVLRRVGQNAALAEDVTQDCLVRVWQTREDNPPPSGALVSYLLTTAQNLLRDRHRRTKADVCGESSLAAKTETPERAFVQRETVSRLLAEAALLPPVLRETLRLRVAEGLEYGEIAVRMGCPTGTVKSRLNAARAKLRAAMEAAETLPIVTAPASEIRRHTVSHRGNTTTAIVQKEITMTTKATNEVGELRAEMRAMEARLAALEQGDKTAPKTSGDYWETAHRQFAAKLGEERDANDGRFAVGFHYVLAQSVKGGMQGSASCGNTFGSAASLPDNETVAKRAQRVQALTANPATLRAFRHFFALRFAGKEMRATAAELAEATSESAETITALLAPFVADRTLLLVSDGAGSETYEWEGNHIIITALLLAADG